MNSNATFAIVVQYFVSSNEARTILLITIIKSRGLLQQNNLINKSHGGETVGLSVQIRGKNWAGH